MANNAVKGISKITRAFPIIGSIIGAKIVLGQITETGKQTEKLLKNNRLKIGGFQDYGVRRRKP